MYTVQAPAIYVHESVWGIPEAAARAERMLAAIEGPAPVTVNDADLDAISAGRGWHVTGRRLGELKRAGDPAIVLNTLRRHSPEEAEQARRAYPHLARAYLLGSDPWTFRDGRATRKTQRGVCQNAWELHSAWGCLHRCDYCDVGEFLNILVNLEELVARLDPVVQANPWCKLYKYDNHTDTIAFEPEYGASDLLVRYFAAQSGRYLMLYTKSDNVEHLLSLPHGGHTIVCWTLSCDTVSRLVEKGAPTTAQRIAAAEACQRAGYAVRARFSPIVPVHGWREENAAMIGEYLSRVRPDVLTMDTFKWLEPRRVGEIVDLDLWDPEYRSYIEEYAAMPPEVRPAPIFPNGKQLFPHEARARVYRFFLGEIRRYNERVPVSLCGETPEMWEELRPELGMTPEKYVCACGPTSTPDELACA